MAETTSSLILVGAGHASIVAMRLWLEQQIRLPSDTLMVTPTQEAWYSGMMPGLVAGKYAESDCAIDVAALCRQSGIKLIKQRVIEMDADKHQLRTADGNDYLYQALVINAGGRPPSPDTTYGSIPVVPVKPFSTFVAAWEHWQQISQALHLTVLGGGAASIEISLALKKRFPHFTVSLVCSRLLAGYPDKLASRSRRILSAANIQLLSGFHISELRENALFDGDDKVTETDALILATGAAPLPWYPYSQLACDQSGFITAENTLQSTSHPEVFVCGDALSLAGAEHSGVHSVKQGSILAENIPAWLKATPLVPYHPQKRSLALLDTADNRALMRYGPLTGHNRLFAHWKAYLDTGFIKKHRRKM